MALVAAATLGCEGVVTLDRDDPGSFEPEATTRGRVTESPATVEDTVPVDEFLELLSCAEFVPRELLVSHPGQEVETVVVVWRKGIC